MYLNIGQHEEWRTRTLEEAYKIDPYNVATVNFIRLLDELDKFQKQEYEHVTIYFDPKADPIVGDVVGKFMDDTAVDLSQIFSYTPTPANKPIIQVYPEDDEFSVRMAGVPGVENFGVSFGRVLATISPRVGTNKGNFNWGRVLRHELVHTFNLLSTHHRVPRWVTEGLAVWQEHVKYRFKEVPPELYKRTMDDSLFTIKGFADAFTHPKRPGDGEQAYTQGAWLAMYMDETYGRDSIVRLLDSYSKAQSDEEAFKNATGKSIDQIETEWHAWMKVQISPWNLNEETDKKIEGLDKEGDLAIKSKQLTNAVTSYEQANALQPTALKPHQRLAYLYLQKETSDPAKAIEHMKFLHVFELQNNRFAKQIARMYLSMNDLDNAYKWAHEAAQVDLYDPAAYELIQSVCEKMNKPEEAQQMKEIIERIKLWQVERQNKPETTPKPTEPQ
ncbi:MAG: peptidase MA family metallohydrolase [Pirellulales bacterium]